MIRCILDEIVGNDPDKAEMSFLFRKFDKENTVNMRRRQNRNALSRMIGHNNFYYPDERLRRRQSGVIFQQYDNAIVGDDLLLGDVFPDEKAAKVLASEYMPPQKRSGEQEYTSELVDPEKQDV